MKASVFYNSHQGKGNDSEDRCLGPVANHSGRPAPQRDA